MVEEIFHKLRLAETRTYGHVRSEAQMNGTILLFTEIVNLKDFFRRKIQINLNVYCIILRRNSFKLVSPRLSLSTMSWNSVNFANDYLSGALCLLFRISEAA